MGANVKLLDLYPERFDKSDLADYIIEGLRPTIDFNDFEPVWAKPAIKHEVNVPEEPVIAPTDEEGKIVRFWSQDKKIELVPSLYIQFLEQEKYRKITIESWNQC